MRARLTRREALSAAGAAVMGANLMEGGAMEAEAAGAPPRAGGLCLNEDDSHYFSTRAGKELDAEKVASWVDQYAGTQVRELMLCPNAMRASYGSKVWDPIWHNYDPSGPDGQPLLASTAPAGRAGVRGWIHTAWKLDQAGIDPYALWIARARKHGISPWLSMRMNDIHNVDDERSFIHSEFWRQHPEYRRVPYRFMEWADRAFDYGRAEVREYHMSLIRELVERYDFDGLELDWMRFGFHFRPGHEAEGAELLTQFTAEVRRLLTKWQRKRGHRIRLGARVPSRPQTALGLGMDAVTWARQGLVDMLVVTPFWATAETDIPIETWKGLLHDTRVTLAAGLEVLVRPHPGAAASPNSLQTVRGAASAMLDRGADRVYLFNYMDSDTAMEGLDDYPTLLRECGSLGTLAGKARRHVVTYADTWAPGEPRAQALPSQPGAGQWVAFRVATGPKPSASEVTVCLGVEGGAAADAKGWQVRVNGDLCEARGAVDLPKPKPVCPVYAFAVPLASVNRGYDCVEVCPDKAAKIVWVEMAVGA